MSDPVQVEFLTPAQAQTLLDLKKTAFYRTIKEARPPIIPVTLPGMTETRFRKSDLMTLPDRVPGSAKAAGLALTSYADPQLSIYEYRESERNAELIKRGQPYQVAGVWYDP